MVNTMERACLNLLLISVNTNWSATTKESGQLIKLKNCLPNKINKSFRRNDQGYHVINYPYIKDQLVLC